MKTTLRIILACILIMAMGACDNKQQNRAVVEQLVLEAQQTTPTQIDAATVLTFVNIEDDNVVYHYTVDESIISIEELSSTEGLIRSTLANNIKHDAATREFTNACSSAGMSIVMAYSGTTSDSTFTVTFSPEQLAN